MVTPTNMPKPTGTEKYDGPGKITSMLGTASLAGIPAGLVTGAFAIPLAKSISEATEVTSLASLKGFKRGVVGILAGTALVIYGAVRG